MDKEKNNFNSLDLEDLFKIKDNLQELITEKIKQKEELEKQERNKNFLLYMQEVAIKEGLDFNQVILFMADNSKYFDIFYQGL